MRICCVIASLGSGGAERVMTELCRAWSTRGDDVVLITLDDGAADFYTVPAGVRRVALDVASASANAREALTANVRRVREVRRAVREARPDIVVSFTDRTNILVLLATSQLGIPTVVAESIDPRRHSIGTAWNRLRSLAYPFADLLVVQTRDVVAWAEEFLPSDRVHAIANPVRLVAAATTDAGLRANEVVALGRLVPQKGFDTLLRAFAQIRTDFADWTLSIYGEGPLRHELTELGSQLGLESAAALKGRTNDADSVLRNASVFVLSSRYEGFPNALLEACASGCACISTNCPSGPSDVIEHERNGLLVPVDDANAMANELRRLMSDAQLRTKLGRAARVSTERFEISGIIAQWDQAFSAARRKVAA
jgi:glycosyltransferase involved in cell wall biosynthesis